MARRKWLISLVRMVAVTLAVHLLHYVAFGQAIMHPVVACGLGIQFYIHPSPIVAAIFLIALASSLIGIGFLPLSLATKSHAAIWLVAASAPPAFMLSRRQWKMKHGRRQSLVNFVTRRRQAGTPHDAQQPLYLLVVLGSGGHTKEMLIMMEHDFRPTSLLHRRYLVSSGDHMSLKHLEAFEASLQENAKDGETAGTYDVHVVPRARRVHQSILTTPFTAIQSIIRIFPLLLRGPEMSGFDRYSLPDIIVTNGPATGFFVALAAFLLRVLCLAPESKMRILFVESWARIKTLSLTGKLLYHTGIADLFLVQHDVIAKRYKVPNAGWLVLGKKATKPGTHTKTQVSSSSLEELQI